MRPQVGERVQFFKVPPGGSYRAPTIIDAVVHGHPKAKNSPRVHIKYIQDGKEKISTVSVESIQKVRTQ